MNKRGFTLIEILVSLAAIGIMMTVVILRFQGVASAERSLNISTDEIRSVIQLAQDYSRSSYDCCEGEIIYAYGIFVDLDNTPGQYLIFADKNNNFIYDGIATDAVIDEFNLPNDVEFDDWWYDFGMTRHVTGDHTLAFPIPSGNAYDDGVDISRDLRIGLVYPGAPKYKYFFVDGSSWQVTVVQEFHDDPIDIPPPPGPK
ncbi:type II secretion system GspH family protein [Patescibacteria group bacterium]|nr:type II secretion system GspH family protein [Patescibacteria group bacterium]MBU1673614.1 type II secretion system GspH family protein [Patescibacteria group bacterium]MBU1963898.1 type II secretion system GspH family protein [Patescibacteria group bacterium]